MEDTGILDFVDDHIASDVPFENDQFYAGYLYTIWRTLADNVDEFARGITLEKHLPGVSVARRNFLDALAKAVRIYRDDILPTLLTLLLPIDDWFDTYETRFNDLVETLLSPGANMQDIQPALRVFQPAIVELSHHAAALHDFLRDDIWKDRDLAARTNARQLLAAANKASALIWQNINVYLNAYPVAPESPPQSIYSRDDVIAILRREVREHIGPGDDDDREHEVHDLVPPPPRRVPPTSPPRAPPALRPLPAPLPPPNPPSPSRPHLRPRPPLPPALPPVHKPGRLPILRPRAPVLVQRVVVTTPVPLPWSTGKSRLVLVTTLLTGESTGKTHVDPRQLALDTVVPRKLWDLERTFRHRRGTYTRAFFDTAWHTLGTEVWHVNLPSDPDSWRPVLFLVAFVRAALWNILVDTMATAVITDTLHLAKHYGMGLVDPGRDLVPTDGSVFVPHDTSLTTTLPLMHGTLAGEGQEMHLRLVSHAMPDMMDHLGTIALKVHDGDARPDVANASPIQLYLSQREEETLVVTLHVSSLQVVLMDYMGPSLMALGKLVQPGRVPPRGDDMTLHYLSALVDHGTDHVWVMTRYALGLGPLGDSVKWINDYWDEDTGNVQFTSS